MFKYAYLEEREIRWDRGTLSYVDVDQIYENIKLEVDLVRVAWC